jgi:hypothetical protein
MSHPNFWMATRRDPCQSAARKASSLDGPCPTALAPSGGLNARYSDVTVDLTAALEHRRADLYPEHHDPGQRSVGTSTSASISLEPVMIHISKDP